MLRQAPVEHYGINLGIFVLVLLLSEILYHFGIIVVLRAMFRRVTWKDLRSFRSIIKSGKIGLNNPGVASGWIMNRLGASIPWVYVMASGWGQLPWFVIWPMFIELTIVITIGLSFSLRANIKKSIAYGLGTYSKAPMS